MHGIDNKAPGCSGDEVVHMYPNNELKKPIRKFEDTFSVALLLRKMFPLSK